MPPRKSGVVLIEVMVAVAVAAAGLVFVFRAFAGTLHTARTADERLRAVLAAEAREWASLQSPRTP